MQTDKLFTEFPYQCCSVFLRLISLMSLFLLLNKSNPHAPTLEHLSFVKTGLQEIAHLEGFFNN